MLDVTAKPPGVGRTFWGSAAKTGRYGVPADEINSLINLVKKRRSPG